MTKSLLYLGAYVNKTYVEESLIQSIRVAPSNVLPVDASTDEPIQQTQEMRQADASPESAYHKHTGSVLFVNTAPRGISSLRCIILLGR